MTTRCCPGHLRRTAGRLAPSGRGSRPERGAVKAPGHLPGPHTCPVPQVLGRDDVRRTAHLPWRAAPAQCQGVQESRNSRPLGG
jgi:hypothetical protein